MGIDQFSITLDKPSREYSPGESLSGKVVLNVSGVEHASELKVRFSGAANTYWEDPLVYDRHNHAIHHHYHGHEVLFQQDVRLLGTGESRLNLPDGNNTYPFKFQVPTTPLPVSCSFGFGGVAYGVEGVITNPWYSSEAKSETLPVTILPSVDLNMILGAGDPVEKAEIKICHGCCNCFSSPQVCTIRTFTPKLGFCTGEAIPLVVEIDNLSRQICSGATATLTQLWKMTAFNLTGGGTDHRENPVTLKEEKYEKDVKPGEAIKWEVGFTVPVDVPPTQVPGASEIISMEYVIYVEATIQGRPCEDNDSLQISHPVTVGTIPLTLSTPTGTTDAHIPKYDEKGGLA